MNSKTIAYGILRAVAVLIGIILLLWFLYKIQSVLVYIAFASVISLMGRPLVLFLKRKLKFNNTLAVVATLFIVIGLFLSIFTLFVPIISEQGQLIGQINIEQVSDDLNRLNQEVSNYFKVKKLNLVELIKQTDLMQFFDLKTIPNMINSFLSGFGAVLIGLFSVLFISFFLLKDSQLLENSLLIFAKKEDENRFMTAFNKIKDLLSRYFVGLLLQIFILFVLYTILLLVFGVHNAIAVALIAAIFNLIPYIGPLFGGIFVLILATTSNLGLDFQDVILPKLSYILIGYLMIQLIDNFLNQPLIFGNSVKSHPLEIFLAILIFGLLFGIGGLIVAVPFYTAIKVIAKEFLSEYKIVKTLTKDL
ncbi:AI-2E family transporter [Aquimarina muelleri]|uniref:AI-2E family transporter n=1 Tax=Aquimarina muelleri TaxID=279356 RepID=A0A918JZ48_9FLAO|nr:AI-2E family transporter [Aquimarina muelleri]MCX2764891.1 AI-2E family transporter [Aquimarina muelleri]GGX34428.1 AI-2E family transporter [Aquimarina muelleri]